LTDENKCNGGAENPELRWNNQGAEWAQSYVLVMDDITNNDDFIHWMVKDIPADVFTIPRGASGTARLPGVCRLHSPRTND
jgi:phosphatidylethanolamine-binding protein (PEBP) family uncharacterized protein